MTPSLFIVVPTLNSYALLPRLLDSLQQQSYLHWRVLFVDGASGPEHRQWLEHCCAFEARCQWVEQDPEESGIFGAMNQGFIAAGTSDWLLFWGSDDWAASPTVFADLIAAFEDTTSQGLLPDLLVCGGRYFDAASGALARATTFHAPGLLKTASFRRALLLGSTPPHQATLFGPRARQHLARYAPGFRLTADLNYFLQLSRCARLCVQCLDLELVHIADGGVSGQQTQRRLQEVQRSYRQAFGWRWWFPFLARYLRRLASLLPWNR